MTLDGPGAPPGSAGHFPVGARLQAVRRMRGLSQREVARRAGITNGSLSLIEQGRVSPSLGSLEKILQAIPLTLSEFFADAASAPAVHKAGDWTQVEDGPAQARLMRLASVRDETCYLVDCELLNGASQAARPLIGTSSYMAGVVLQGTLEVRLEGARHCAEAGDGFQFSCHRDQQFFNPGTSICRFVLFVQMSS